MSPQRQDPLAAIRRFALSTVEGRWVTGLGLLFLAELVASAVVGHPLVNDLLWQAGSPPWTLLTRLFVQGPGAVFAVAVWLWMLYVYIPRFRLSFSDRTLLEMAGALALGQTLVAVGLSLAGLAAPPLTGWTSFAWGMFVYLGLWRPHDTLNFFGLFQFPGKWLIWGPLGFIGLMLLAGLSTGGWASPLVSLGVWAGAMAWWELRGGGRTNRRLRHKGSKVARGRPTLRALDGGRRPTSSNRPGDDDVWH